MGYEILLIMLLHILMAPIKTLPTDSAGRKHWAWQRHIKTTLAKGPCRPDQHCDIHDPRAFQFLESFMERSSIFVLSFLVVHVWLSLFS